MPRQQWLRIYPGEVVGVPRTRQAWVAPTRRGTAPWTRAGLEAPPSHTTPPTTTHPAPATGARQRLLGGASMGVTLPAWRPPAPTLVAGYGGTSPYISNSPYSSSGYSSSSPYSGYSGGSPYSSSGYGSSVYSGSGGGRKDTTYSSSSRWKLDRILAQEHQVRCSKVYVVVP